MNFLNNIWGRLVAIFFSLPMTNRMVRSKFFVEKFDHHVIKGETILDLGCGTGHIGLYLKQCGQQVTLIDVKARWGYVGQWLFSEPCAGYLAKSNGIHYSTYNGSVLPFDNESFDTVLVAFVLHHADDPDSVLSEAMRVARKRIIVLEDTPDTEKEARFNRFADAVVNLEIAGHPHANRSKREWESKFLSLGLKLVQVQSWTWTNKWLRLPFPNILFVLEK